MTTVIADRGELFTLPPPPLQARWSYVLLSSSPYRAMHASTRSSTLGEQSARIAWIGLVTAISPARHGWSAGR
jgi:hypothetical protein